MLGAFNTELDLPRTDVTTTYLIMSQPRTGSSMISLALAKTGLAGVPDEYFHKDYIEQLSKPLSRKTLQAYYQSVVSRRTTANGVFGMKLHHIQFRQLFMDGDAMTPSGEQFLKSFDRIVLTSRRDKIAQAISNLIALRTGHWNSVSKQDEGRQNYSFSRDDMPLLLGIIRDAVEGELFWNALCDRYALRPLRIVYEDLSTSPQAELMKIADHLGLQGVDIAPQTVKISADSNRHAKAEFLRLLGVELDVSV